MENPLRSHYQEELTEAGCDEAGRGCYAGPVFAAAVVLPMGFFHPLLNDSKQVTEENRNLLRIYIEANAIAWSVARVDHDEIDEINILNASFLAMHRALDQLSQTPELLLIEFAPERWGIDLPGLLVERGYRRVLKTKHKAVYERK